MCVGVHLKCPLPVSSFKQAFSYLDRYSYKNPHYKVTQKNPSSGSRIVSCGQTHTTKQVDTLQHKHVKKQIIM